MLTSIMVDEGFHERSSGNQSQNKYQARQAVVCIFEKTNMSLSEFLQTGTLWMCCCDKWNVSRSERQSAFVVLFVLCCYTWPRMCVLQENVSLLPDIVVKVVI